MKINVSIDDMCPHPQSSCKVLDMCYGVLDDFPDAKFSLFIPMAYTRYQEETYKLSDYEDFCSVLKKLPPDKFELGWHGYYHGILNKSSNDEFRYLSYEEACSILENMFSIAKEAGIYDLFTSVFRPPAFWMSPQSFKACRDKGIETLSLVSHSQYRGYDGADSSFDRVVYYDYVPPTEPIVFEDGLQIVYHACEWDQSYFSQDMVDKLKVALSMAEDKIEFGFIKNM